MAQVQPGAKVAPRAPSLDKPAAGNSGVFIFSLLLFLLMGGFFCIPAQQADGSLQWKWSVLFDGHSFPLASVVYLILAAVAALVLLVFGLFIRNGLRGALYAILGLAGVGVMVWMLLAETPLYENGPKAADFVPAFSGAVLGADMLLPMKALFVLGVALLFSVMIGAARARVLFPDNGSSKAWSVITSLGLLAIFAVPVVIYKTYAEWTKENPLLLNWAKSSKDLLDFAAEMLAAFGGLVLVLTSLFGVGGGRSSRGRGVFVMGVGLAIAIGLPVYFYVTQVEAGKAVLLAKPFANGTEAFNWVMDQKRDFLAGASAWAFLAMIGLGISDLICQGRVKKLAAVGGPVAPPSVRVTPTGGQPVGQFNRAAPLSPQQQRLDEIAKLYNAGLLSEEEYNRRRAEIMGR